MARKKVLVTVTTYPLPSRSYDELVCTAGILEDGTWIRIYPVPLSFLKGMRSDGVVKSFKYNWIELDLKKRTDDFRPESHSPINYDFRDIRVMFSLNTKRNWAARKKYCLAKVYTNLEHLIANSKAPKNVSLATFKPTEIVSFEVKEDEREWKKEWKEQLSQLEIGFEETDKRQPEDVIRKLPYKFYYKFKDDAGKECKLMIEDWEIGALYWNCLRNSNGDENAALQKVRNRYETEFIQQKDLYFFLGTTKEWHTRRAKNPFVIIGVFYPKIETQLNLNLE